MERGHACVPREAEATVLSPHEPACSFTAPDPLGPDAAVRSGPAGLQRQASRSAAWNWCDLESARHPPGGSRMLACSVRHMARLMARDGWGVLRLESVSLAEGRACIHWRPARGSAFPVQGPCGMTSAVLEGWLSGSMDWVLRDAGRKVRTDCHFKRGIADRNRLRILLLRPAP